MKHTFLNLKSIFTALAIAAIIPVSAKDKRVSTVSSLSSAQPTIKYVGSDKSSSLFVVEMNAENPVYFQLVIREADGTEIYRQGYESTSFQQYFKLVNEGENEGIDLRFSLEPFIGNEKIEYTAKSESPLKKDVIITRL